MNSNIYITFIIALAALSIFFYDIKYIRIRMLKNQYSTMAELQDKYEDCMKEKLGPPCEIMKQKLDIMLSQSPSILSAFFIWICDGLNTMFNALSPKNFILLIILIISLKLFTNYNF